jgi:hypothetical protein
VPPHHPWRAFWLEDLAAVALRRGAVEEALPLLRRALAVRQTSLPPGHYLTARSRLALARALFDLGELSEAGELAAACAPDLVASLGESHPDSRAAQRLLASLEAARAAP